MFFGSYSHSLDDKNRLMIPSKMRESLSSKLFMMRGFDGAISVYEQEAFNALMNKLEKMAFLKKDTRSFLRTQLANTYELDVDKLGRIQIPTPIINKFNIGKEVIVLGACDHIEIWDKKAYEAYQAENEARFEDIAENLSTRTTNTGWYVIRTFLPITRSVRSVRPTTTMRCISRMLTTLTIRRDTTPMNSLKSWLR